MSARGYRMKVITVDRSGRQKGPSEWVDVPPAQRFSSNGMAHIQDFVQRVLSSDADSAWITIGTPSGRTAIGIAKQRGRPLVGVTIKSKARAREAAVRAFFARRGICASSDYLAGSGGVPNAVRVLDYPLPSNASKISKMAADLLKAVYRLNARSPLDIRFTEREQPNNPVNRTRAGRRRSAKVSTTRAGYRER